MKLIVGLGNPGEKYENNRHNAGSMFADYLHVTYNTKHITSTILKYDKYLHSEHCILNSELVLLKPQTYMNNSGTAVAKAVESYKLKIENLIVAHDDLDIPLGMFKIQKGTGPQLHNGLDSIEQHLYTKEFWRLRIGVDNRQPENRINGETYVLNNFTEEEKKTIEKTFSEILNRMKTQFLINI